MKLKKWMNALNKACLAAFEISIYDLPDQDFEVHFENGLTPQAALDDIAEWMRLSKDGNDYADWELA